MADKNEQKYPLWKLEDKIEKAISSNIEKVEWEGEEVDTMGMKESFLEIIYDLCPEYKPEGWGEKCVFDFLKKE